jgi:hypothetical protein
VPPPTTTTEAPPRHRGPARPALAYAGLAGLAVGVGAIIGGAVLLVDAGNLNHDFNHPAPGTVYDHGTVTRFQTDQAAGIGLVAAGGALLVAGTVATIIGFRHPAEPTRSAWWIAPTLAPSTMGAASGFRF